MLKIRAVTCSYPEVLRSLEWQNFGNDSERSKNFEISRNWQWAVKALKSVLLRRHLFIKFRTLENSLNGDWRLRDYSSFHSCEIFPKVPPLRKAEQNFWRWVKARTGRVGSGPNQNALKRERNFLPSHDPSSAQNSDLMFHKHNIIKHFTEEQWLPMSRGLDVPCS